MSLETWKAEFYPVEAISVPEDQAVEHSLQKWYGLRKENLKRHGVRHTGVNITDDAGKQLAINGHSCALCRHHPECTGCPLVRVHGVPCDEDGDMPLSPYVRFIDAGDPEPMIEILELALAATTKT